MPTILREGSSYKGNLKKVSSGDERKDEKPGKEKEPKAVHGDNKS